MSASAPATRRCFTVEEFQRMGEAGVFAPDARVELIDGEIIEMTPVGPRHVQSVFAIEDFLRAVVGPEVRVVMQNALQTPSGLPWPDAALLVRERLDPARIPGADACLLVVEVADSSRLLDLNGKRRMYAVAGVPEYWIVDLRSDSVVRHLTPIRGDYADVREYMDAIGGSPRRRWVGARCGWRCCSGARRGELRDDHASGGLRWLRRLRSAGGSRRGGRPGAWGSWGSSPRRASS